MTEFQPSPGVYAQETSEHTSFQVWPPVLAKNLSEDHLIYWPELGMGYYPVVDSPYDQSYWDKYVQYDNSIMGYNLTKARADLVRQYADMSAKIVDVGIGAGGFVKEINGLGTDINPVAINWLKDHNAYHDFAVDGKVHAACFWDSLEHIHDPSELLGQVEDFIFVSCPIYDDSEHILRSKHFRKDEHCWYWTFGGFTRFVELFGFKVIYADKRESDLGREDIWSFACQRVSKA